MLPPRRRITALLVLALLALAACDDTGPTPKAEDPAVWQALGVAPEEAAFDEALARVGDAPVDAKPEVGKHYSYTFPPDLPFDPSGWTTGTPGPAIAIPSARRGGTLRLGMQQWVPTLRTEGPNSRLKTLTDIHELVYETLLKFDTQKNDFVPNLATHWKIEADKQTFRFRIDPRARWADGRPVTSHDVVVTIEHLQSKDRKDLSTAQYWSELVEYAKVLDRYTVEVKAKEKQWRSFLTIALGLVYPAAYYAMDGQTYISEWNWKLPPGTGPYELRPEDLKKNRSLSLTRRADWWQNALPRAAGQYNFDKVTFLVVRDRELMLQKVFAGELDAYPVNRAQRWVDELDKVDLVQKGWLQIRKIYTLDPNGYGGFCFNMRKPPFDSLEVRTAFSHLFNREKLFEKFLYYQYDYTESYFPGQEWGRPNAQRIRYDPEAARTLLASAGYVKRDEDGHLVKADGTRFPTLSMDYGYPGFFRLFSVVKDDLWNEAGIELELKQIDYPTLLKKVWDGQFQLVYWSWTASQWPDMYLQFHSKFADQKQSNNLNGFKNPRADAIMVEYRTEFDAARRKTLLQELDRILFDAQPYALGWYAPYFRVVYWDKFGHPPEYCGRYSSWPNALIQYWWHDPDKERRTAANKGSNRLNYPDRPLSQEAETEPRYWLYNRGPMPDPRRPKGGTR